MPAKKSIALAIGEFFALAFIIALVPYIVSYDANVLKNGVSEYSITEFMQQGLILLSYGLFMMSASRCHQSRVFLLLTSNFFLCVLIREADIYFDQIQHGFWVYPVSMIAAYSIYYAHQNRYALFNSFAHFSQTKPYFFLLAGLLIVLVFSRTFGSGKVLWSEMMGPDYQAMYKSAIQEGLELLGYILITYGAVTFYRSTDSNTVCDKQVSYS